MNRCRFSAIPAYRDLAMNMFALWVVGRILEPALGRTRYLAVYLRTPGSTDVVGRGPRCPRTPAGRDSPRCAGCPRGVWTVLNMGLAPSCRQSGYLSITSNATGSYSENFLRCEERVCINVSLLSGSSILEKTHVVATNVVAAQENSANRGGFFFFRWFTKT